MILSDRELMARLAMGELVDNLLQPGVQVQPASIDLRLGYEFRVFNSVRTPLVDTRNPATLNALTDLVNIRPEQQFIVHPGEFVLGATLERVMVPHDLVARLEGRSSIGRLGLIIHSTAGFIDPGFDGTVTLEISNLGRVAVALYAGMRICQIVFEMLSSPVQSPYGPHRNSKYQGQQQPTVSRISQDVESR